MTWLVCKVLKTVFQSIKVLLQDLNADHFEPGATDLMVRGPLIPHVVNEALFGPDSSNQVFLFHLELEVSVRDVRVEQEVVTLEDLHHEVLLVQFHRLFCRQFRLFINQVLRETLQQGQTTIRVSANFVVFVSLEQVLDAFVVICAQECCLLKTFSSAGHFVAMLAAFTVFEPGLLSFDVEAGGGEALGSFFEKDSTFEVVGRPLEEACCDGFFTLFKGFLADWVSEEAIFGKTFNHVYSRLNVYN